MSGFVNGENLENSIGDELKEKPIVLPKNKKYLVVTNDEGNVKGYFPLKSKSLGRDWIALYQKAISAIADAKLSYEEYRVFLKLLSKVDFENYLTISQTKIAEELDMYRSNVARAIKGLTEKNIIVEGPRAGLHKTYCLNPYVAHKGANRKESIIDFEDELSKQGKNIIDASRYFD